MSKASARTLAAACVAGLGAAAGAAAYLAVRGLPGVLYAAGLCLAAVIGAIAIVGSRSQPKHAVIELTGERETPSAKRKVSRWTRKSRVIADLQLELVARAGELEEHRHALANLATQLSRESEEARRTQEQLEAQLSELTAERDGLLLIVTEERERFERTLDELGGGIGRHGDEITELKRELEALIAR
jgi:predicted RNase H-like nuclease (RuvC/YqgF family)